MPTTKVMIVVVFDITMFAVLVFFNSKTFSHADVDCKIKFKKVSGSKIE